jgi:hypothetical protein
MITHEAARKLNVDYLEQRVIPALRNPQLTQGHHRLRQRDADGTIAVCCLGVMTQCAIDDGIVADGWVEHDSVDTKDDIVYAETMATYSSCGDGRAANGGMTGVHVLPTAVADHLGMREDGFVKGHAWTKWDGDHIRNALWSLNDTLMYDLERIADEIAALCRDARTVLEDGA